MSSEYSDDDYDDADEYVDDKDGHPGEISSAEEFRLVKIKARQGKARQGKARQGQAKGLPQPHARLVQHPLGCLPSHWGRV